MDGRNASSKEFRKYYVTCGFFNLCIVPGGAYLLEIKFLNSRYFCGTHLVGI